MEVIVVGGGIVGLASAYELAGRGADVRLFERGSLGMESTARSVGGIRSQFDTRVNVALSEASKPVWNDFAETFGVDIEYRKHGYLFLARTEELADTFRSIVEMQRECGAPTEVLEPEEATAHCPGLQPSAFRAATYNPEDGYADAYLAVRGYASGARERGVDVRTNTAVTDVRRADGAVVGVETDEGTASADFVVNAAGPFARRVGEMAGLDLPIAPRRRQVVVLEPTAAVPETDPLTVDLERGSYFRPERDGDAIAGGHFAESDPDADPTRYDDSMDLQWAATAVERAAAYADYFGPETRIKRGWAGLYAVTPDNHPIIEEALPGFVVAGGFSGHGFQHAPATGTLVAELVFDGTPNLVDVSDLTSDRFQTGDRIVADQVV